MSPIDHERHSERLGAYVRGTLGPDETEETRAHLAGCPMCRHEEAALIALISSPVEGLRPDEGERLRAAVLSEITSEQKPSLAVAPSRAAFVEPRRSWAPRIAQFMAAAAVIALAAIYLTNPGINPIGGADSGPAPAANGRAESEDGTRDRSDGAQGGGTDATAEEGAEGALGDVGDASGGGRSDKDTDTRTRGGDDASPTTAVAAGEVGSDEVTAPEQVTGFRAGKVSFGAEAAYRGRR